MYSYKGSYVETQQICPVLCVLYVVYSDGSGPSFLGDFFLFFLFNVVNKSYMIKHTLIYLFIHIFYYKYI